MVGVVGIIIVIILSKAPGLRKSIHQLSRAKFNYACVFVHSEHGSLLHKHICEQIHSYNNEYNIQAIV